MGIADVVFDGASTGRRFSSVLLLLILLMVVAASALRGAVVAVAGFATRIFGEDFSSNDLLNNLYLANWNNDPTSTIFDGMSSDGNGNWYSDPSGIVNQPDFEGYVAPPSNNTEIGKLLAGLGLPAGLANTLGTAGALGLIGTNLYQDYQTNELQQAALEQLAINAATQQKIGDANIYRGFTDEAGQQTTSARDNLLLRHYMEQTQPYNREREFAILGKSGVDTSGMRAMANSQSSGLSDYVNSMLGYENKFNGYASDLTNMRDQDQMYNSLKPNRGALNTMAVSQPPQIDYMSTIPAGADPSQVAAYKQFLGVA